MCVFLLSAVIFGYAPRGVGIAESDIWWHLLNARELLQHHSLSSIDTRTFTVNGLPWLSFEWMSELPFYLAFRSNGWQGVVLVYAVVSALIFAGVYYLCCRAGADCKDAALATLGAICIGTVSLAPRTLLFGWLCLVVLLILLDHFSSTGKHIWLLPVLFAVWINLHGSWVYGIALVVLRLAAGCLEGQWGAVVAVPWSVRDRKRVAIALAASVAALFINPFGYKLVWYPFDFLLHQQAIMRGSQYWLPIDFSTFNGKLLMLLLLAVVSSAWFSKRRWQLHEVLWILLALWSALSHSRFLDFAAIITIPILSPRLQLFPPYQKELDKPWLNAAVIAAVVAFMVHSFPTEAQLDKQIQEQYPVAAVEFMQQHGVSGGIFNSVEFGGYLEWHLPAVKPFIDGRGDIFVHHGTYDDYQKVVTLDQPLETLDKYHITYILLERNWALAELLTHSPEWRVAYADHVAVLYERNPQTAAGGS